MSDEIEQVITGEQAAILLYAEIATDPDLAADLYTEIENLVEISINQDDMTLATGIKLQKYFSHWFNPNIQEPEQTC